MIPHKTIDLFLCDLTTETLPSVLASTVTGDLNAILSIIKNQHLYEFSRGAAIDALVVLYKHDVISREKIISIFDLLFDELYDDHSLTPSILVSNCCDIYATELTDKINKYFKANIIDEGFISYEDIQENFSMSYEEAMEKFYKEYFHNMMNNLKTGMNYLELTKMMTKINMMTLLIKLQNQPPKSAEIHHAYVEVAKNIKNAVSHYFKPYFYSMPNMFLFSDIYLNYA